jgi:hypothetical protein
VIPEAPFVFSIAALSVTLAGFAGLVAAFRRGGDWTAITVFRLREIAEFGFGNALLALVLIPLSATTGDVATALSGTVGSFEWELLFLLSRPMLAFVLVLASLRHD